MKRFIALILAIALQQGIQAQTSENPFELRFRVADTVEAVVQPLALDPDNPFELRARPEANAVPAAVVKAPKAKKASRRLAAPEKTADPAVQILQIKLWTTIGLLVLLTFLLTLFRHASARAFAGFFNDNLFFQAYREQEGRGILPFLFLYLLFPINAGIFIFFALHQHAAAILPGDLWMQLALCIGFVMALLALKHLILAIIGYLFPVGQELGRYNFLIIVFGIVLGLLLSPVNILLAFGPEQYRDLLIYGGAIALGIGYLFRFLRGVLIANKFLLFHQFHFLLYICTVEIAPVLNFIKLFMG